MHISENVRKSMRLFAAAMRPPAVNCARANRGALVLMRRDADDLEAACIDTLADLQHWAEREGLDWAGLVARAQDHRNHEQPDDPRDIPAAPLAVLGPGGDFAREIR